MAHHEKHNLTLLRAVSPVRPNQVWQAGLTSVRLQPGVVRQACVLNGFTHEVLG